MGAPGRKSVEYELPEHHAHNQDGHEHQYCNQSATMLAHLEERPCEYQDSDPGDRSNTEHDDRQDKDVHPRCACNPEAVGRPCRTLCVRQNE